MEVIIAFIKECGEAILAIFQKTLEKGSIKATLCFGIIFIGVLFLAWNSFQTKNIVSGVAALLLGGCTVMLVIAHFSKSKWK